jgi:hypothetical protein
MGTYHRFGARFILLHAKTKEGQESVPPGISCAVLPPAAVPDTGGGGNADDPLSSLDRDLDELPRSAIAFNTPRSMQLEESETVTVLLSPSASVKHLARLLEAEGASGSIEGAKKIRTAPLMEARLTGQDFKIDAISDSDGIQPITREEPTRWTWDIEPTEPGEGKKVHLTVSVLVKVEGETTPRLIETFNRTIVVNVTMQQRLAGFAGFAGNHWEWLWTAILVPLAVWAWPRWRKRRTNRVTSSPPPVRQDQPPTDGTS